MGTGSHAKSKVRTTRGEMWQNWGEEGERKKSKRKQNGIRAGKEACWREGVRGRAGKLILNMENRRGG